MQPNSKLVHDHTNTKIMPLQMQIPCPPMPFLECNQNLLFKNGARIARPRYDMGCVAISPLSALEFPS